MHKTRLIIEKIESIMYSADIRTRINEYDRMRTQNMRMKNLMKRSHKLKEQLKSSSKTQTNFLENIESLHSGGSLNRSKRGRSSSPQRASLHSQLVTTNKNLQYSFVDPSMFW